MGVILKRNTKLNQPGNKEKNSINSSIENRSINLTEIIYWASSILFEKIC